MRDLLGELPDEVGDDLELAALSCTRLGWITLLEDNGYDRLLALDAMAAVMLALGVDVFPERLEELTLSSEPASVARAMSAFELGRPRAARDRTMGPERAAYLAALDTLVERPLPAGWRRLELAEMLTDAWRLESDAAVRERTLPARGEPMELVFFDRPQEPCETLGRVPIPLGPDVGRGRHRLELRVEDGPGLRVRFFRQGAAEATAASARVWTERALDPPAEARAP